MVSILFQKSTIFRTLLVLPVLPLIYGLSASVVAQVATEEFLHIEPINFLSGENGIIPQGVGPASTELFSAESNGNDWLYHTHDYAGSRYSPLEQIDTENVNELQVSCLYQVGGEDYFQSGPLVYEGVLYLTAGARTMALHGSDCNLLWSHNWEYLDQSRVTTNRGVAIKDGYVVRGTADGYLVALDAVNGQLLWARQIANPREGEHFTMAPLIYEDKILIGPAGGSFGISGWIGAFSLDDGQPLWRFHTVPGAMEKNGDSWGNPLGIKIGGGAIWTPLSLDVATESLFVAVSNPAPDFPAGLRPGDNLYTNSVLSLSVNTGELKWFKQMIPGDDHGWDLTQVSPLFSAQLQNHKQDLISIAGKDGLLRVLDRNSSEQIFQTEVSLQQNVNAPVTTNGTYSCPGVIGGVLWNGPALDRKNTSLITPSVNLCSTFYLARETRYVEGKDYFGGTVVSDPETLSGWVTATDGVSGQLLWRYESELPVVAGVTTTAGGLVLAGELSGDFFVLNSETGNQLYRFNTGGAIGGGIISYSVDGQQYIAVASGRPSQTQVNGEAGSPTLIIFTLPDNSK